MSRVWKRLAGGVAGLACFAGSAGAVTIIEAPDWVVADSYYLGAGGQPAYPYPWPVVRFDVTNDNSALGVYSVLIGARPGVYNWSGNAEPAMLFGNPWTPQNIDFGNPPYLPQMNNNGTAGTMGSGDGTIDWTTELLRVQGGAAGALSVNLTDTVTGLEVALPLTSAFTGYDYVYRFETNNAFVACIGGCSRDSVPIRLGSTFSFYVTGGIGSPFVYLDGSNYSQSSGALVGTFAGAGMTVPVPEPTTAALFAAGVGLIAGATLRRRRVH